MGRALAGVTLAVSLLAATAHAQPTPPPTAPPPTAPSPTQPAPGGQPGQPAPPQPAQPGPAQPAPPEDPVAQGRRLFAEGIALEERGDWAGAREKFAAADRLKTSVAIRFHLALCAEHLGRLEEALTLFEAVRVDAEAEGAKEVLTATPPHIDRLRAQLGRVTVRAPNAPPGVTVALEDGRAVPLDTVIAVKPGAHTLTATIPGAPSVATPFDINKGAERTIILELLTERPASPPPPPAPVPVDRGLAPGQVAGAVIAATGVVAAAASIGFYVARESRLDEARLACGEELIACPESARPVYEEGRDLNTVGNVLSIGGGILAVGGLAMLVTLGYDEPSAVTPSRPAARVRVRTGAASAPLGLTVQGAF